MSRLIGIRHRIKFTREEEPRPTEVAIRIVGKKKIINLKLDDEDAELDWVNGNLPVKYRKITLEEDISAFLPRHIKWKKLKKGEGAPLGAHTSQLLRQRDIKIVTQVLEGEENGKKMWHKIGFEEDVSSFVVDSERYKSRKVKPGEDLSDRHTSQIFMVETGETTHYAAEVPVEYDGLQAGDRVVMALGGSGDPLAFALSRKGQSLTDQSGILTGVYRLPPALLKEYRELRQEGTSKENDPVYLIELFEEDQSLFYLTGQADRDRIELGQLLRNRQFAQADRKAAFQRHDSRLFGRTFMQPEYVPELSIKDLIAASAQKDVALQSLLKIEDECTKALAKKVVQIEVYNKIFAPIKGVGPVLGASLMVAIGDPRRFMVKPDPEVYGETRNKRNNLMKQGRYEQDKEAAYTWLRNSKDELRKQGKYKHFLDAKNFPSNLPYNEKLAAVGKYKVFKHQNEEADALFEAAELTKKLCKMQRDARNKSMAKMCAFVGVHVLRGGKYEEVPLEKQFPRRRSGQVCNWSPLARQALYLLADQFNRRKDSEWGKRFLEEKRKLREEKHPEPVKIDGKMRYTNGHIHKMAIWKTLNKFVRWLYREWVKLEEEIAQREAKRLAA